jgi:RNA polymerase sigma-70 factor (ECF subfamily)
MFEAIGEDIAEDLQEAFGVLSQGARVQNRHRARVVRLYEEIRPSLEGYLLCLGLVAQQADDIVQESFLRLFQAIESGLEPRSTRAWVFRVAHNLAMNVSKIERRHISATADESGDTPFEYADPSPNPEEIAMRNECTRRLCVAVSELTSQQRECFHLRAEGLRYREIAIVLGIGTSRVQQLFARAMAHLMERLYE